MNKFFEKIGRKKTRIFFCIAIIILFVSLIAFSVTYTYTKCESLFYVCIVISVVWCALPFLYITVDWQWQIKELMDEYNNKNNVLCGGLAILLAFAFPFLIILVFSQIAAGTLVKEIFDGIASLFIAAMPAFIALLGVQYTTAIQERNRKEDLRLGAKPFFSVRCFVSEMIADENGHNIHKIKVNIRIKNISQNIGIPLKVVSLDDDGCETDFKYFPLAPNEEYDNNFVISSIEPYKAKARIAIFYKDVYNTIYKMHIEFLLHENSDLSDTCIICDEAEESLEHDISDSKIGKECKHKQRHNDS